jgi:predicted DNA-binding transcriptional regulator AlpA
MRTDTEKMEMLSELIWNKRMELAKARHRMIKDNEMAHYLGVSVGSFNQWVNKNRLPGYDNILRLSVKLGPEVFDIMEHPRLTVIADPELQEIAEKWNLLSEESRNWIIDLVKEKTDKK